MLTVHVQVGHVCGVVVFIISLAGCAVAFILMLTWIGLFWILTQLLLKTTALLRIVYEEPVVADKAGERRHLSGGRKTDRGTYEASSSHFELVSPKKGHSTNAATTLHPSGNDTFASGNDLDVSYLDPQPRHKTNSPDTPATREEALNKVLRQEEELNARIEALKECQPLQKNMVPPQLSLQDRKQQKKLEEQEAWIKRLTSGSKAGASSSPKSATPHATSPRPVDKYGAYTPQGRSIFTKDQMAEAVSFAKEATRGKRSQSRTVKPGKYKPSILQIKTAVKALDPRRPPALNFSFERSFDELPPHLRKLEAVKTAKEQAPADHVADTDAVKQSQDEARHSSLAIVPFISIVDPPSNEISIKSPTLKPNGDFGLHKQQTAASNASPKWSSSEQPFRTDTPPLDQLMGDCSNCGDEPASVANEGPSQLTNPSEQAIAALRSLDPKLARQESGGRRHNLLPGRFIAKIERAARIIGGQEEGLKRTTRPLPPTKSDNGDRVLDGIAPKQLSNNAAVANFSRDTDQRSSPHGQLIDDEGHHSSKDASQSIISSPQPRQLDDQTDSQRYIPLDSSPARPDQEITEQPTSRVPIVSLQSSINKATRSGSREKRVSCRLLADMFHKSSIEQNDSDTNLVEAPESNGVAHFGEHPKGYDGVHVVEDLKNNNGAHVTEESVSRVSPSTSESGNISSRHELDLVGLHFSVETDPKSSPKAADLPYLRSGLDNSSSTEPKSSPMVTMQTNSRLDMDFSTAMDPDAPLKTSTETNFQLAAKPRLQPTAREFAPSITRATSQSTALPPCGPGVARTFASHPVGFLPDAVGLNHTSAPNPFPSRDFNGHGDFAASTMQNVTSVNSASAAPYNGSLFPHGSTCPDPFGTTMYSWATPQFPDQPTTLYRPSQYGTSSFHTHQQFPAGAAAHICIEPAPPSTRTKHASISKAVPIVKPRVVMYNENFPELPSKKSNASEARVQAPPPGLTRAHGSPESAFDALLGKCLPTKITSEKPLERTANVATHNPFDAFLQAGNRVDLGAKNTSVANLKDGTGQVASVETDVAPKASQRKRKQQVRTTLAKAFMDRESVRKRLAHAWTLDGARALEYATKTYSDLRLELAGCMASGELREEDSKLFPHLTSADLRTPSGRIIEIQKLIPDEKIEIASAGATNNGVVQGTKAEKKTTKKTPKKTEDEIEELTKKAINSRNVYADAYAFFARPPPQGRTSIKDLRAQGEARIERAAKIYALRREELTAAYGGALPADVREKLWTYNDDIMRNDRNAWMN